MEPCEIRVKNKAPDGASCENWVKHRLDVAVARNDAFALAHDFANASAGKSHDEPVDELVRNEDRRGSRESVHVNLADLRVCIVFRLALCGSGPDLDHEAMKIGLRFYANRITLNHQDDRLCVHSGISVANVRFLTSSNTFGV